MSLFFKESYQQNKASKSLYLHFIKVDDEIASLQLRIPL
jgi:hypothetical protein